MRRLQQILAISLVATTMALGVFAACPKKKPGCAFLDEGKKYCFYVCSDGLIHADKKGNSSVSTESEGNW